MSLRYSIYKVQFSSLSQARLGSPRTFICYHISRNLSRTFSSFFKFLFVVFCAPGGCHSSHNFLMISHELQFVKHFFLFFEVFLFYHAAFVDSLHIIPPHSPFVKHFFTNFAYYFCAFYQMTLVRILRTQHNTIGLTTRC